MKLIYKNFKGASSFDFQKSLTSLTTWVNIEKKDKLNWGDKQ